MKEDFPPGNRVRSPDPLFRCAARPLSPERGNTPAPPRIVQTRRSVTIIVNIDIGQFVNHQYIMIPIPDGARKITRGKRQDRQTRPFAGGNGGNFSRTLESGPSRRVLSAPASGGAWVQDSGCRRASGPGSNFRSAGFVRVTTSRARKTVTLGARMYGRFSSRPATGMFHTDSSDLFKILISREGR